MTPVGDGWHRAGFFRARTSPSPPPKNQVAILPMLIISAAELTFADNFEAPKGVIPNRLMIRAD